jgi:long-chain acyl-CoA synthetase
MLYDRWREVVREFRDEVALRDVSSGEHWTFAQLDSVAESGSADAVMFASGRALDFIGAVLRGWRSGAVVCPLEPGQSAPQFPLPAKSIVHLKLTSASTGPARLVAVTAGQLAADARNIIETMGLRRDWPNIGVISLAHSYGFSNLVTPLLLHGIPLVITNSPLPENLRSALARMEYATLPAVPALWRAWFDAGVLSSKVRLAISAGAPLPLQLEQEIFDRFGIKVHNFYGSTECGGIAYDVADKPRTDASYAGLPMKSVQVAIDGAGCLEVRSAAVAETYWPEASDRLAQGCFRTTDLARITDGGVYLCGRASDVINIAGRKISPESVENILSEHPEVRECVVFGVPEGDRERIVACVVAGAGAAAEDLKQFMIERVPAWQVPRDFWLVKELPADRRGKLPRASMRERYLSARG